MSMSISLRTETFSAPNSLPEVPHGRADAAPPDERGRDRAAEPATVHPDDGFTGADSAHGGAHSGQRGPRARTAQGARLHADSSGRRRAAPDALVAGPDAAQPALRHRDERCRRLPDL